MTISVLTYDVAETREVLADLSIHYETHATGEGDSWTTTLWLIGEEHVLREAARRLDEDFEEVS